ncbi:hypothetical protein LTR47_004758 [Exophiala xenobiotica]|nr:hypothetical protein LTR47_004758 [Exophiala xenobiotica]KAK5287284.1 hypothetical protein LTR14_009348 [Exophiala xenobiotica]KAK5352846.1 hypothetical protein LTR61_003974 [Exophiala xenobiotica]KAK5375710.1 hypothetical protein LTR11_005262 [Exophiala xenobiotica]KAK5397710.1 hypothetical protein LTR79_005225 [Exophiala xenobiotica]
MFSGPMQYLEVYLPSPTTVSFTVTTRRPQSSSKLRFRLGTFLRHAFRILLVYCALAVNIAKARDLVSLSSKAVQHYLNTCLQLSPGSSLIEPFAQRTEWWILAPLSLIVVYLCLKRDYVGRLTSIYSCGLYTASREKHFCFAFLNKEIDLSPTTTFIPTAQIQDIVIHEAFKGLGVRFYLAVIVEGGTEVVVVFPVSDLLECNAKSSFEAGAVYTDTVSTDTPAPTRDPRRSLARCS